MNHVHLDAIGGAAGDMFAACLLDAFPGLTERTIRAATAVSGAACALAAHRDHVLGGSRFVVDAAPGHHHHHTHWASIRARIEAADLGLVVKRHAVGIFALLADAEARVHGVEPDAVAFHEVGAADSIADIVAAAVLIDAMDATWSVSALPVGGGRVRTAHGVMPVPAPATALLLEGFSAIDDGVTGERVTPTGAAILRHLDCHAPRSREPRRLARTGIGFGTRMLPGISNCLRAMIYDEAAGEGAAAPDAHRTLAVIAFEVDDQSAEDLAAGLDFLRAQPGVHDVLQMPAFGKKGRMTAHVQVLAAPASAEAAIEACFRATTTIGLRLHTVEGRALPRRIEEREVDGRRVRIKHVERPGGATAKIESDDLLAAGDQAARARLRRRMET